MQKRTVLVVDDQQVNRKILQKILENEYTVLLAENGQQALEILRENAEVISAVLLDIVMPVMDGYHVLENVKNDEVLSKIPMIVSSERDGDEAELRALSLGAQDFIAKPYKADIIRRRLQNIISLRETAAVVNKAEKDPLTGLYNKQFFMEKVSELLENNPDVHYDLFCFDVERFKLVNDIYGVKKGNELICYIADILKQACTKIGVVGHFEADKFFTILYHQDHYQDGGFEKWGELLHEFPIDMELRINCGIYDIHDLSIPVEAMCDRAQLAAKENKGKYNSLFSLYDDSIRERLLQEQFISGAMTEALQQEQFVVYYQPKYDLNTETVAGAEALVRWIHPEKGFMSPGAFIPIFEKNGFITQLDAYVWERACRDIRDWMDLGYPPVAISVNVSRADIYNPKLISILQNLLEKYNVPMRYLHLEITESAYTENPQQIIQVVEKLRNLGFVIEMDDFGSGYSSLNMLSEMPVDVLKLDMRFIQNESASTSGKGILSFVISLAKWLDLAVVAEGVETKEQITSLRSMDCNYVQGYYYSKPLPEKEFAVLLHTSQTTEMVCTSKKTAQHFDHGDAVRNLTDGRVMLIVDDIDMNRAVLASAFVTEYVIEERDNGQTAWEYLEQHYADVDIVMLDLLMPVMDGFQLLDKIRMDARMQDLPVIITSQGDGDSERRALEMNANDFISKPYNCDIIKHRVHNVIAGVELKRIKERKHI